MSSINRVDIPDRYMSMLDTVSNTPFGSARDYASVTHLSVDSAREYLRELEKLGFVSNRHFGTPELASERRWWASMSGYRDLLTEFPHHADQSRIRREVAGLGVMKRRPDVAAIITRLVARLAPFTVARRANSLPHFQLNYFNAGPLDCLVEVDTNRFLGVICAGPFLRGTSLSRRLNMLKKLVRASRYNVLILTAGVFDREVALRQLHDGGLRGAVAAAAVAVGENNLCWRSLESERMLSHWAVASRYFTSLHFVKSGRLVVKHDLDLPFLPERRTPVRNVGQVAALSLPPLAKRFMVLLGYWPLLPRDAALNMLRVSAPQFSDLLRRMRDLDLVATDEIDGAVHYSLSDAGIAYASVRDRRDGVAMLDTLSVERREDGARRGSVIGDLLSKWRHDRLVTEAIGNLAGALRGSEWRITETVPPRQGRMAIKPDEDVYEWQADLSNWRVLATDGIELFKDREIDFYPDAIVYLSSGGDTIRILFELELSTTTVGAWQKRLEKYLLHSFRRQPGDVVLFVIGSSASESLALAAQTGWVRADRSRSWLVATTTVDLMQTKAFTSPIWRVDAADSERLPLFSLPRLMRRGRQASA